MSVKIRLQRLGRKKRPFYRIVAIDSKKRRDGLEIERLGWYDPIIEDTLSIKIDEEKTKYWINKGAIPSDTVKSLIKKSGLSYKWSLENSGLSNDKILEKMKEWDEAQYKKVELLKKKKEEKKLQKQRELDQSAREAAAEEAPVEEAPVKEAATEEALVEEAPTQEISEDKGSEEKAKK